MAYMTTHPFVEEPVATASMMAPSSITTASCRSNNTTAVGDSLAYKCQCSGALEQGCWLHLPLLSLGRDGLGKSCVPQNPDHDLGNTQWIQKAASRVHMYKRC